MKYTDNSTQARELGKMDVDAERFSLHAENAEKLLEEVIVIKNQVIGNKRQKIVFINQGLVGNLLSLLNDPDQIDAVKVEAVTILGSLAKGRDKDVANIISAGALVPLLQGLSRRDNPKYVELCLCCLRTITQSPASSNDFMFSEPTIVPLLLSLVDLSPTAVVCVATLLSICCQREEHQNYIHSQRAVEILQPHLTSRLLKVEMAVLQLYCALSFQNRIVANQMLTAVSDCGTHFKELLCRMLGRDKPFAVRMLAAKCLTHLHRSFALAAHDSSLTLKVIPTLVAACRTDRSVTERVEAAHYLAYLTEVNVYLQGRASITDHCIKVLVSFFNYDTTKENKELLLKAGLKALASLTANDENIRKKVIELNETIKSNILQGLTSSSLPLKTAAARCLHSLSRSVQQLRTVFPANTIDQPLMQIIKEGGDEELMKMASSALCNLLLEFSPSKASILAQGAVELLVNLSYNKMVSLRLNSVWGLMNMAFNAEENVKMEIVVSLGTDQLFCLLKDVCPEVVMKTLGLLRNLLTNRPHIDSIMNFTGEQVIQAVVMILESDQPENIKEQTLCLLGNVADGGNTSKEFLMNNEDILKKIIDYMKHPHAMLQIAAVICVYNLVSRDDTDPHDEVSSRQQRMKSLGVYKVLNQLLNTNDKLLFERAKATIDHYNNTLDG